MRILLVSEWLEILHGKALAVSLGSALFLTPHLEDGVITDSGLREGRWRLHFTDVTAVNKRTRKREVFSLIVAPPFTISKEELELGAKELNISGFLVEVELPQSDSSEERILSLGSEEGWTTKIPVTGPGKTGIVCPEGRYSVLLKGESKLYGTFMVDGSQKIYPVSLRPAR